MSDLTSAVPEEQIGPSHNPADHTNTSESEPEEVENSSEVESSGSAEANKETPDTNHEVAEKERENDPALEETEARDQKGVTETKDKEAEDSTASMDAPEHHPEAKIDFAALPKEDLVALLREMFGNRPVEEMMGDVESIKINFYKKHKADIERQRKAFISQGGELEEFTVEEDPLEAEMKELLRKFRDLKSEYNKALEEQKGTNLEKKYRIIEQIKDLVTKKESINRTFHEFRELQRQWREIGPVPQQNVKDMWDTYHHHVEAFYDFIRINKELRDLDFKKNLETKIELCEKAEELLLHPNIIEAFRNLQDLHEQWREIGPVPADMRAEIWDRFKEATAKINKKHQEHFVQLKGEQKKNLAAKSALCEQAEEYSTMDITSHREWTEHSRAVMDLQKVWKTIGFAPKKDNVKIYKRFRDACDAFFNRKREYYNTLKEEQNNNLQIKTELCIQAEAMADSTEWKKTMDELIALQRKWKEIGPVPHKLSDKIWKRFRTACDKFFERKAEHLSEVDNSFESNLLKKQELISEIESYVITDNAEDCLKKLKEFQRRWSEIGFVPLKKKDEIHESYRQAINKKFDQLRIDDGRKNMLKFRTKIDSYLEKPNGMQRIRMEREKYINRLKQLENDIVLWENNIGFFTRSRNAETMIKEVESKIESTKKNIEMLNRKINIIDDLDE
jgi:hypothetical protein